MPRYEWEHCILRHDIEDRRVVIGKGASQIKIIVAVPYVFLKSDPNPYP